MRELQVRIKFTTHCLGAEKRQSRQQGKLRTHFEFTRSQDGRVLFLNTWWRTILKKAAQTLCRHQKEIKTVRFSMEVDGDPRPIPSELYHRYYETKRFAKHEAFFPGDIVGVTCLVPTKISDEDFYRLLTLAGKYYGISPARPFEEFGFFSVESIRPTAPLRQKQLAAEEEEAEGVNQSAKVEPPVAGAD